jgi:hypothetical protein
MPSSKAGYKVYFLIFTFIPSGQHILIIGLSTVILLHFVGRIAVA